MVDNQRKKQAKEIDSIIFQILELAYTDLEISMISMCKKMEKIIDEKTNSPKSLWKIIKQLKKILPKVNNSLEGFNSR